MRKLIGALKYIISKKIDLSMEPHLDEEALEVFKESLIKCQGYLEYGMGGSTLLAARSCQSFVSIETDKQFFDKMKEAINGMEDKKSTQLSLLFQDIGPTKLWGKPKDRSLENKKLWKSYIDLPWQKAKEEGQEVDLVLIDGRFRVACALKSLIELRGDHSRILFDDYFPRAEYHEVEKYAVLVKRHVSMAIFKKNPVISNEKLAEVLEKYITDFR